MSLGNIILYETEFQRITAILAKMQKELRADLVMLISKSGQQIASVGPIRDTDLTALASLAAANLAATDGLAHVVGESEFSVLYHQGRKRSLHISDLFGMYCLVLLFDASISLGLVRWKIKRSTASLQEVFRDFQHRLETSEPVSDSFQDPASPRHFTDEELERLLGR